MKVLLACFLAMFIYGMATHHYGPGFISLGMIAFVIYGKRELNKRDAEFRTHPSSATKEVDTLDCLCEYGCECSGDRI